MAKAHVPRGIEILRNPALNKGTAFTEAERDALGLHGLLPPRVCTAEEQQARVLENLRRKSSALEKYIFLSELQERNETLFHRVLQDNLRELMPIIYTPTVGEACQGFGHIFRNPKGLYLSRFDKGRIAEVLRGWPQADVGVVVVTDGERILGLGDQGANGMGISIGKLALYTACAGIAPARCLPVMIDVGTENEALLADPLYLGVRERRLRGAEYDALLDEFADAVATVFPGAVLQLEDFATKNAFGLLERFRSRMPAFDDDIQGTAAVAVSGLLSALRITGGRFDQQRILFLGAGEAGTGIANLFCSMLVQEGMPDELARRRCWLFDKGGLLTADRLLSTHQRAYGHAAPNLQSFLDAIEFVEPTAIIGVSGAPHTFTREVLQAMARLNERPIVFALSNPTSKAECTAEEAYRFTSGTAVFASGSPFPPCSFGGRTRVPGQGNNAYVFPGIGLGVLATGATRITDDMFAAAARTLANLVSPVDLEMGRVYPDLTRIREVSIAIALAVAEVAVARGFATTPLPPDLRGFIRAQMYEPLYRQFTH
jgi:malate dehydrogenase (oxaloacetate-decarboxylating)(NADP+)